MPASGDIVKCCLLLTAGLVSVSRAGAGLLDQAPEGWTYKGCFGDLARAMDGRGPATPPGHPVQQGNLMTVRMCRDYAIEYSFQYFGLQAGSECFLSNDIIRATKCGEVPEGEVVQKCSTPCAGQPTVTCGGAWVNEIYRLEASGEATYIGCYYDTLDDRCWELRALRFPAPMESVTPKKCADAAKSLNQTIFGLQAGYQCFVGSDYAKAVAGDKLPDEHCQQECTGNKIYYCGGFWANAVYVLQEEQSPSPSPTAQQKPSPSPAVTQSPSPSPTAQQQPSPSPAVAQSPSTRNPDEALVTPSGIWSTAQKVGIALGIAAGICTIAGFVFGMWRHFQKKKKKKAACTSKDSADPAALDVVMR